MCTNGQPDNTDGVFAPYSESQQQLSTHRDFVAGERMDGGLLITNQQQTELFWKS